MATVKIRVPATTANLGCGFDVFGMALDLYNEVTFIPGRGALTGEIHGEGADTLVFNEQNLFYKSMKFFVTHYGVDLPHGHLVMEHRIPMARGLGSSSAAVVGGVFLANQITGLQRSKEELLPLVVALEGHPDNVTPCLLGGFCSAHHIDDDWQISQFSVPSDWRFVVVSPRSEVSTQKARAIMPQTVSLQDAIQTISGAAALIGALVNRRPQLLQTAFADRLHVPYRLTLIPHGREVLEAALQAGAYASTISGSGSTLLAVSDENHATAVGKAMKMEFGEEEAAQVHIVTVCADGVARIPLDKETQN